MRVRRSGRCRRRPGAGVVGAWAAGLVLVLPGEGAGPQGGHEDRGGAREHEPVHPTAAGRSPRSLRVAWVDRPGGDLRKFEECGLCGTGVRVPIGGLLGEQPGEHLVDPPGGGGLACQLGNRRAHVSDRDFHVGSGVRRAAGEARPEETAQRVEVAGWCRSGPLGALGSEIRPGARHRAGGREATVTTVGDAEVAQHRVQPCGVGIADQHVAALHIAVHDADVVRLGQRLRDLRAHQCGAVRRHGSTLAQQGPEFASGDVLGGDERRALELAVLVDPDDVVAVELGEGFGLVVKTAAELRGRLRVAAGHQAVGHHLEGNLAARG